MDTSLVISVEQLGDARERFDKPLSKAFLEDVFQDAPHYHVRAPAELVLHATKVGERDVLLEAKTSLALDSECRRCLTEVKSDVPVAFMLNLVARPAGSGKGKKDKDEDSGEGAFSASFDQAEADEEFFDGEKIDLAPILREQLLLAVPSIEPLCREACKGLCTTCGQDLNEKDCGHSQKAPDPRWAALKDLKV